MADLRAYLEYFKYSILLVVAAAVVEGVIFSLRGNFNWKGLVASYYDKFLGLFIIGIFLPAPFVWIIQFVSNHQLFLFPRNSWLTVSALLFAEEFVYYWHHRACHRIRWFWTFHLVHHSTNQLNIASSMRRGFLAVYSGTPLFFLPLIWVGFDPGDVFFMLGLNLFYQAWIHVTWIPKLGWLEFIFNTPSAHRVHHARNPEYIDSNYGGILIIFDRIFGTYRPERNAVPCDYGLVEPQPSDNPFRIVLSPWWLLMKDLGRAGSFKTMFNYLLKPPGWTP